MEKSKAKNSLLNRVFIVTILLFCLILVLIWFREGKLLATGEDGLMLANPQRSLELYQSAWSEVGPGVTGFAYRTRTPFFYVASLVTQVLKPWIFQAGLFYILLISGSLSTYYLTKEIVRVRVTLNYVPTLAFISAIFYILNPISLLGVWYRFIYTFMFLFALAPLFFYLFLKGLHKQDLRFVFLSSLLTLPFSYAYGSPASAFLIWLFPIVYTLLTVTKSISNSLPKLKLFPVFYIGLAVIFWAMTNLWWITPYKYLFTNTLEFTQQKDLQHNIGTLQANSKDFSLANVTRLIHGGFLYRGEVFGPIYKNPLFLFLSWTAPIMAIFGLTVLKNRFLKYFFLTSFILLIFLSKGTSPPFGQLFLWLFTNIPPLQLFRNPLEKFGPLLPLVYAPLFALGVVTLTRSLQKRKLFKLLFLSIVLSSLFLTNWPFFTGAIVVFGSRDIRVVVPDSFKQASTILVNQDHRILTLPLMGGGSGRYKWEHNYAGIESSEHLFGVPTIARVIYGNTFFDDLIIGFSRGLAKNNLIGFIQLFSADLLVYRKDTDVQAHGAYFDALEMSDKMIKSSNLKQIFDSKEFSIFELPKDKVVPLIFTPTTIIEINSAEELLSKLDAHAFDPQKAAFICKSKDKCNPFNPENKIVNLKIDGIPKNVKFYKKSSTKYSVEVEDSPGEFLLVFSNSYHPGWQVISDGNPVLPEQHLITNGYANGFVIRGEGDLSLDLVFTPQGLYSRYANFTYASILLGIIIVFVLSVRRSA